MPRCPCRPRCFRPTLPLLLAVAVVVLQLVLVLSVRALLMSGRGTEAERVAQLLRVRDNLSTLVCVHECPESYRLAENQSCRNCGTAPAGVGAATDATNESAADTIVLIVPYRHREQNLQDFSQWLSAEFLPAQQKLHTQAARARWVVWVVEQADAVPAKMASASKPWRPYEAEFNKGFLVNVGLRLVQESEPGLFTDDALNNSLRLPPSTCIVQHDIDFLPSRSGVDYSACVWPRQLSAELACSDTVYGSPTQNSVPYPENLGGVVSMRPAHWVAVNGFSNFYPGWGGEVHNQLCANHESRIFIHSSSSLPLLSQNLSIALVWLAPNRLPFRRMMTCSTASDSVGYSRVRYAAHHSVGATLTGTEAVGRLRMVLWWKLIGPRRARACLVAKAMSVAQCKARDVRLLSTTHTLDTTGWATVVVFAITAGIHYTASIGPKV